MLLDATSLGERLYKNHKTIIHNSAAVALISKNISVPTCPLRNGFHSQARPWDIRKLIIIPSATTSPNIALRIANILLGRIIGFVIGIWNLIRRMYILYHSTEGQ